MRSLSGQSIAGAAFVRAEDLQNEKTTYLDELIHIGKEVGLPSWSSDPRAMQKSHEDYLVRARTRVLEIARFDNFEIRTESGESMWDLALQTGKEAIGEMIDLKYESLV